MPLYIISRERHVDVIKAPAELLLFIALLPYSTRRCAMISLVSMSVIPSVTFAHCVKRLNLLSDILQNLVESLFLFYRTPP